MLEKQKAGFKLNKKIKDDVFNVDLIAQYNLSLQVNSTLFRVCVTDTIKNRCLLIEDYQLSAVAFPEELIRQLEKIYDDHHFLKAGYWKSIKLAIKNTNFSLIPDSLFDKQYLKEYLNINCVYNNIATEEVYYYKQNSTNAVNIFSADAKIIDWFSGSYPGKKIKVIHHTSPLIEAVMVDSAPKTEKSVYIQVEKNYLTILVKKEKTLEFCNTFYFSSTEDFVYYVMFVFDQLKLDPEKIPVIIWGEILPDSAIYNKLFKYIRYINFGNKPSSLQFGYYFDEVFDHNFYDLYSMHFCE